MAKAINWPTIFYDEIINEDTEKAKIALRLGTLYYDNDYYFNGEMVDIRVNHKIIRKALIQDKLKICKIKDLDKNTLSKYKESLNSKEKIINFLSNTYDQEVNEDTTVTIVTYKNLPIVKNTEEVDDPHI